MRAVSANQVPSTYEEGMPGYVLRDWEVIDYECYQLAGTELWFRGPRPASLEPGHYVTALGAAQTFGCFCPRPYPALLAERLGIEALNLGYSGAGPAFFLRHPELIEYVNRSAFCVVQVMSGRSTSNSLLHNPEGLAYGRRTSDGRVTTAEAVFDEVLERAQARLPLRSERLKRKLLRRSRLPLPSVRRVVMESRSNWMQDYRRLLQAITVPTILFWFSTRTPFYIPRYHHRAGFFRAFPHMVNASMIRRTRMLTDHYVECVTQRGSPQPLTNRFTGKPATVDLTLDTKPVEGDDTTGVALYDGTWTNNSYYPSPEMHADAADALAATCKNIMADIRS